ncbi:hypothetical protein GQ43DRAFT_444806 [Delitschia confertaspora ATCC 74209]|uniref:Uncharacterized protein n=1 Tax=Delitschia confertaspora ATCC 74209 TaxID=1513339 RepID=A0A9P4JGH0_9PLEO|nr:hypothetical protein GQ43DRAFT_444806 [Delitschia confertaspora ATCC 74209]
MTCGSGDLAPVRRKPHFITLITNTTLPKISTSCWNGNLAMLGSFSRLAKLLDDNITYITICFRSFPES